MEPVGSDRTRNYAEIISVIHVLMQHLVVKIRQKIIICKRKEREEKNICENFLINPYQNIAKPLGHKRRIWNTFSELMFSKN